MIILNVSREACFLVIFAFGAAVFLAASGQCESKFDFNRSFSAIYRLERYEYSSLDFEGLDLLPGDVCP